ncbi:two-component system response regulator YesN [Hydrogenispora ethanolica]|uniref:Two-component system response regulator YesN n=1 Tax=Hydrogenispora ethanolica TaxID=1082276 RepID=A0A4R1S9U8_HYDET|nr:two-component system response regulator YesN [Hydrogenispora ethanolica]
MLKVMIVDDEILAVEDLAQLLPWERYGFEIVATATHSLKALDLYRECQPDLIFVDIRMPVLDGLAFSRKVLARGNPVKIVLLTAYKDFEYAKQALELGVSKYLVKHELDGESLAKELRRIKAEIEDEERARVILKQELIKQLLSGEKMADSVARKALRIPEGTFHYALLLIRSDQPFFPEFRDEKAGWAGSGLELGPEELPAGIHRCESAMLDSLGAVVAVLSPVHSQSELRGGLCGLGIRLQARLREGNSGSFSILISRTSPDLTGLAAWFQPLAQAFQYAVFWGRERVCYLDDLLPWIDHAGLQPQMPGPEPPAMPDVADRDTLRRTVAADLERACRPRWNLPGLTALCRRWLNLLQEYRAAHGLPPLTELHRRGLLDVGECYCSADLPEWFAARFQEAARDAERHPAGRYSRRVQQAVAYLQQHYREDIAIETVARALGISGVYLSQLFKKETGRTLVEYLTDCRIAAAKGLLQRGEHKVHEVAKLVGYKSSQYFSQVFHKVTGVFPLDYKEGGNAGAPRD